MRYAVVDGAGLITNVVELANGANWTPPAGSTIVLSDTAEPGGTYIGGVFSPAPRAAPPVALVPTLDQIYDETIATNRTLKALISAINDGSLPIGAGKTPSQLRAIIKARM